MSLMDKALVVTPDIYYVGGHKQGCTVLATQPFCFYPSVALCISIHCLKQG
ncbi:Uncharacterised protein [Serratia rubidaea]|uniref:Uncharacterized protein n=1 Tax=Serratia rubidaea TaxID=61652 RepID=A0A4U9HHI8_SERRU|nr:Uncharacterised protein [Serratia rubidaea]CAI1845139.1 Uncharacterised protein [Serratia rubidaea]VTP61549.1 Uncharacterised protein [Serratia rubidaea]